MNFDRMANPGRSSNTKEESSPMRIGLLLAAPLVAACSAGAGGSARSIAASPPPKDDGQPAQGGSGGDEHSAALEQLKIAKMEWRIDKQGSMKLLLPDAEHWTRVKFWGVPSLAGFRYGKDHHAIVAAFVTHVDDNGAPGVCMKSFESWANPWVEAFDVQVRHDAPQAVMWTSAQKGAGAQIVDIDSLFARTATLASHDGYAGVYATYPAWKGACLVVGVAVPARDDDERAREVRDRFAKEVLPKLQVMSSEEPKERF
jgi:hypothetical protein